MSKPGAGYSFDGSNGRGADRQAFWRDVVDGVGLALDPLPVHHVGTFETSDQAAFAGDRETLVADRGRATTRLLLDVRLSRRADAGEGLDAQSHGRADRAEAERAEAGRTDAGRR